MVAEGDLVHEGILQEIELLLGLHDLEGREDVELVASYAKASLKDVAANISIAGKGRHTVQVIRGIMQQPISELNKPEFQRLFYEDKMWAIMKNLPEWLNNTWLSLNAFAKQTRK